MVADVERAYNLRVLTTMTDVRTYAHDRADQLRRELGLPVPDRTPMFAARKALMLAELRMSLEVTPPRSLTRITSVVF